MFFINYYLSKDYMNNMKFIVVTVLDLNATYGLTSIFAHQYTTHIQQNQFQKFALETGVLSGVICIIFSFAFNNHNLEIFIL